MAEIDQAIPAYEITVDGSSLTAVLKEYNATVEVQDSSGAGQEADTLTITLVDNGEIELPTKGVKLHVWLGYVGDLADWGEFTVDEVEMEGPPDKISIKARAADLMPASPMKNAKSRSWDNTTIGAIVEKVASENNLIPKIDPELANIAVPHLDQTSASDMHLLANLAFDNDAIAKPVNGCLVFTRKAVATSVSGKPLPSVPLNIQDITHWHCVLPERSGSPAVTARHYSVEDAEEQEVTVGGDDDEDFEESLEMRGVFSSPESAGAAAKSKKKQMDREKGSLDIDMPGDTSIRAETGLELIGFRKKMPISWVVKTATHSIGDDGYRLKAKAEIA